MNLSTSNVVTALNAHHVVLVLQEDGELLEEGDGHQQQLGIFALQDLHQDADDVFVPHLQLCPSVFGQVQQETQGHCSVTHNRISPPASPFRYTCSPLTQVLTTFK